MQLESNRWTVLGDHMTGVGHICKSQIPLSVVCARGFAINDERCAGTLLESLLAVPGRVLNAQQRTVGNEHVVQQTMLNHRALRLFDDRAQQVSICRVGAPVSSTNKDRIVGALNPRLVCRMNVLLETWGVIDEVFGAGSLGISCEAQRVQRSRALSEDIIHVEALVSILSSVVNGCPQASIVVDEGFGWQDLPLWRESEVLFDVASYAGLLGFRLELTNESVIQLELGLVLKRKVVGGNLFAKVVVDNRRVIHVEALQIKRVLLLVDVVDDVRDVLASIAVRRDRRNRW